MLRRSVPLPWTNLHVLRKGSLLFLLLFSFSLEARQKICLTMIVKNEAPIIERCLNSVKDHIDCLCICDTGSTDQTVPLIEAYMLKHHLRGKICHHTWTDFGANRTLSVQEAQKTLEECGFLAEKAYFLFLDADMVAVFDAAFDKEELKDAGYLLETRSGDLSNYSLRLAKATLPWECVGSINEQWRYQEGSASFRRLPSIVLEDRDDSNCKVGKYQRDVALALLDPLNPKTLFHLGLTYKKMGRLEEAIAIFEKCVTFKDGSEESAYAAYLLGECYDAQNENQKALEAYLNAYNLNPKRAEPLLKLSTRYRLLGQHNLALLFAKQGALICYPNNQTLHLSRSTYEYRFEEELSISAFYTEDKEAGFKALNRLILKKNIPWNLRETATQNLLFYVQNIARNALQPIVFDLPFVREGLAARYNPMNPSIQKTKDGFEVICRTVNYLQVGAREFRSLDLLDPSCTIRTRNFLLSYDKHFHLLEQKEICEAVEREKIPYFNSEGVEDCRLFQLQDNLWFTCTSCDTNPLCEREIALCHIDKNTGNMGKLVRLKGPDPRRCEKNWLPFVKEDTLYAIYSCDPFLVFKPDLETGQCPIAARYEPAHNFSSFRGSAAPIAFGEGYLMLVHEVVFKGDRFYLHRFVYLDKNLRIQKVSLPFTFLHQGVEYCCAMTLDHDEKNVVMAIGIEDREAYLLSVPINTILATLEDLP